MYMHYLPRALEAKCLKAINASNKFLLRHLQVSRSAVLQYLMPVTLQKKSWLSTMTRYPLSVMQNPFGLYPNISTIPSSCSVGNQLSLLTCIFCQVIDILRKNAKSWGARVISIRQAHAAIHLQNDLQTQHTGGAMTVVHERCEQFWGRQNEPSSNHTPVKQLQGKHPLRTQAKALQA